MIEYRCDLCEELRECSPRRIEGKIFDICKDCWAPLAGKLEGKGRPERETSGVHLVSEPREIRKTEPLPGQPPDIWYNSQQTDPGEAPN